MLRSEAHSLSSIRLTLIIGNLGPGGAERNIVALSSALADRGFCVTLLTFNQLTPDFFRLPDGVVRVRAPEVVSSSPRWFNVCAQARLRVATREVILETKPHLVISFIDVVNIAVLAALRGSGIPVIVSERVDWRLNRLNWRWRFLRRVLYPEAKRVVVQTQALVQVSKSYWPKWKCLDIANPVPMVRDVQNQRPKLSGHHNIIAVGRLTYQKGFDLLLRAFAANADIANWRLTIVGEGHDRRVLQDQARALAIDHLVDFVGIIDDVMPLLKKSDIFVLSSRFEGFPNALLEAMQCGLPVVAFDCPSGPAEIVRDGVNGLLVQRENVQGLSDAMRNLMEDPTLRARLAARASLFEPRFSPEFIFERWENLINDVLNESGVTP